MTKTTAFMFEQPPVTTQPAQLLRLLTARALRAACSVLALQFLLALPFSAQLPGRLSSDAQLSLVTYSPGKPVHTLFGHGAIRVVDPFLGLDISFNYGTFDFDSGFIKKFMYGELDYYLSVLNTESSLAQAREMGRVVVEQAFDLNPAQRQRMYSILVTNAQPENRVYRYDFLFDNCSTRLVDVLRDSLGSELVMPEDSNFERTFRELLADHLGAQSWLEFGIDLLLGAGVDRSATYEQSWFLPTHLLTALDHTTLEGRPLVADSTFLNGNSWPGKTPRSFNWPVAVCWGLLGLGLVLCLRKSRDRFSRVIDASLFVLVGSIGLFIAFMWVGTLHHVTTQNWNLAWAWPLHLPVGWLLRLRRRAVWLRAYMACTLLVSAAVALGVGIPQELAPAIMPLGLLIAVRAAANTTRVSDPSLD